MDGLDRPDRIRWRCGHESSAAEYPALAAFPSATVEVPDLGCAACEGLAPLLHRAVVARALCPDCGAWRVGERHPHPDHPLSADPGHVPEERRAPTSDDGGKAMDPASA